MMKLNLLLPILLATAGLRAQAPAAEPDKVPGDPLIYFYNARLDGVGQSVAKAAGDVANGQIFDAQLANLDAVAKLATDRIFTSGRRAALAKLEAARTWARLYERVENAHGALVSDAQKAGWDAKIADLKKTAEATEEKTKDTRNTLKSAADLLEEVGKSEHVIQLAKVLQARNSKDITSTDVRVVGKLQEAMVNLGTVLDGLSSLPKTASTRSAADQMKVDLAKAEIDHLNALIQIEEKRLDGQRDVKGVIDSIMGALTCERPKDANKRHERDCTFTFYDDDGKPTSTRPVAGTDSIETTLQEVRGNAEQLKAVVYLLENYAAMAARAETPLRLAELRSAIEERRFAIRRDAIMARAYEQVLLIGAQRIALYYKGGIKPETLAQLASALSTAGLIPTIAVK